MKIKLPDKSADAVIVLVTVTYGDRLEYLAELLRRSFNNEGVASAVVVSNASKSDLGSLERKWGARLQIIRLDANTGSANGYAVGIKLALESKADYLWLMDDDNAPKKGALAILRDALITRTSTNGVTRVAVLGFRPEHQADIASGISARRAFPPRSSFFGFHYRQIFFKIARRLKQPNTRADHVAVSLPYAPYGGLLAARELFDRIGLPKRELVLYADDTEYTRRITADNGIIELIKGAELEDLEGSWNLKERYPNSFVGWLQGGSDFRVFYASRNQAWFDKHVWSDSAWEFYLNKIIFMGFLHYFALRTGETKRLHMLRRSIRKGEESRLGVDPEFPLL